MIYWRLLINEINQFISLQKKLWLSGFEIIKAKKEKNSIILGTIKTTIITNMINIQWVFKDIYQQG